MKHYGEYLPFAGRPVKSKSNDIEILYLRRGELQRKLSEVYNEIALEEEEFENYIRTDWTSEEIEEAKIKANTYNNSKRIK